MFCVNSKEMTRFRSILISLKDLFVEIIFKIKNNDKLLFTYIKILNNKK